MALENTKRFGVFYPLQTFSKGRKVNMHQVPVCLEASSAEILMVLTVLADAIGDAVFEINSRQRKFLHLAAVMVNNFTNHLYHLAEEFLEDRELGFDLLKPLIVETALKVTEIDPSTAQTGPARRGDKQTIQKHLELLDGNPEYKQIYEIISSQILKRYHE
jgi:predicted short-subunit dehydrogenase-like oxidoreductase (DUF2520 family)